MSEIELGYLDGEQCNRNGCKGVIAEHDSEGGCSCHTSPPCSYCVTSREYCTTCDWDAYEEELEEDSKKAKSTYIPPVYKQRTFEDLDKSKIDWIGSGGWHSGMKVRGVYPKGTKREDILEKLGCNSKYKMPKLDMSEGKFYCSWFTD